MSEYTILVVEDQKSHFESLRDYLTDICVSMRITPDVVRVTLKPAEITALAQGANTSDQQKATKEVVRDALIRKIDELLAACQNDGTHVILFLITSCRCRAGGFISRTIS